MPRIQYDVQMVSQQYSPVCWLASAAMILQYRRRFTPSTSDLLIEGIDFRSPGVTVDSYADNNEAQYRHLERLGFAVKRFPQCQAETTRRPPTMAPSRGESVARRPAVSDEDTLYRLLLDFGPLQLNHHVGAFWYGPDHEVDPEGAHAVVLTGIDTTRHVVYFNNPWGDRNVMTTSRSIVAAIHRWEANPARRSIAYINEPMR